MTTGSVNGVHDWRADAATSLEAMRSEIERTSEAVRVSAIQRSLRHIDQRVTEALRDAAIPPHPQMGEPAERTAAAVTAAQRAHVAAVRKHAEISARAAEAAEAAWAGEVAAANPGTSPPFTDAEDPDLSASVWQDVARRLSAIAAV